MDQTRDLVVQQWLICKGAILSGEDDIIILDELTYTLNYGWVAVEEALEALRQRPAMLHVIITGRDAPPELIEYADLVTEMQVIKHPYRDQGIKAQPGIEF
jgi:cob(I)alamin adenosyltransferase